MNGHICDYIEELKSECHLWQRVSKKPNPLELLIKNVNSNILFIYYD